MDALRRLRPELQRCLRRFDDCFARGDTRAYLPVYVAGQLSDLLGLRLHLVAAHNRLNPAEGKFFVSDARQATRLQTRLLAGSSRCQVQRSFRDTNQEVGRDHWECRRWLSLKRHLILGSISYLFLARVRRRLRGKIRSRPSAKCTGPWRR